MTSTMRQTPGKWDSRPPRRRHRVVTHAPAAYNVVFATLLALGEPIRELDDRVIGEGRRGPVTRQIQDTFFAAVGGINEKYKKWLTLV